MRRQLFLLLVLNASFGLSLLLMPQRNGLVLSGVFLLHGFGPLLYGLCFALAGFQCLVAMALWSRSLERKQVLPLAVIQISRRLAQAASLCMIYVYGVTVLLAVLFNHVTWLSLVSMLIIIFFANNPVGHAHLTPEQEYRIAQLLNAKAS